MKKVVPHYWDAEYTRLDREFSAARVEHNARPWNVAAWSRHDAALDAFRAYVDAIHAGYDAAEVVA